MKNKLIITLLTLAFSNMTVAQETKLKVATFNVSMEALNYIDHKYGDPIDASERILSKALSSEHQQIKNIAEIIQTINPDIILLNEFDYQDDNNQSLKAFISHYLNKGQNGKNAIDFPYYYENFEDGYIKNKKPTLIHTWERFFSIIIEKSKKKTIIL